MSHYSYTGFSNHAKNCMMCQGIGCNFCSRSYMGEDYPEYEEESFEGIATYTRFFVYTNNTEYSQQAIQSIKNHPEYSGGEILDKKPEDAPISSDVEINCWGMPSYGYTFYVKDS